MDWIGEEEMVDRSKPQRGRAKGRPDYVNNNRKKNKLNIVFDPESRRRFLTGFRKRKQERKEKYQEKLERELAEEKQKAKEEAKKSIAKKQASSSHSVLPEVEHLIQSDDEEEEEEEPQPVESYDIGNTTVSISSLGDRLFPRSTSLMIKKESSDEEGDEDSFCGFLKKKEKDPYQEQEETDKIKMKKLKQAVKNPGKVALKNKTESLLKKEAYRILQKSDIFKKTLKIKQMRSKKFKLNRLQGKEEAEGERSNKKANKPVKGSAKVRTRGRIQK